MARQIKYLPIGASVKDTKTTHYGAAIRFQVAAKNHYRYPNDSVTLVTEQVVDVMAFDAAEPANPVSLRKGHGVNRYTLSNIRQWMNKAADNWFIPTSNTDVSPLEGFVTKNPYGHRPGLLSGFSQELQEVLIPTNLVVSKADMDGGGLESFTDRVFLLSASELGLWEEHYPDGGRVLPLFESRGGTDFPHAKPTAELVAQNLAVPDTLMWCWLRTPRPQASSWFQRVTDPRETANLRDPNVGDIGLLFGINLPETILVSDEPDADGAYEILWNEAPSIPPSITVPSVRGNKPYTISWGASMDPEGDTVKYALEMSVDGGTYQEIYRGLDTTCTGMAEWAWSVVQFRVRAFDEMSAYSGYLTGPMINVTHNMDPTLSVTSEDKGVISEPFFIEYTVDDPDAEDTLTVTEMLDDVVLRTIPNTERNKPYRAGFEDAWPSLGNGAHALTITVSDGKGDIAVAKFRFTRDEKRVRVRLWEPIETEQSASVALISATYNAMENLVMVEITNNAFDENPAWEDMTDKFMDRRKYFFTNDYKSAEKWGVNVRVTLEKATVLDIVRLRRIAGAFA